MTPEHAERILTFGRDLVTTGDLDPVYTMLIRAHRSGYISPKELRRWCLGYWLLYHPGMACRFTEADNFYCAVHDALSWAPRGTERRHFRGEKAAEAVRYLESLRLPPEDIVDGLFSGKPLTFASVRDRVLRLPQFGPWMAFKIADMGERVLGEPVDFSDCHLEMYRDPVKGAALVYHGDQKAKAGESEIKAVLSHIAGGTEDLAAPPLGDRALGLQEYETILCKYKSHYNGHYPMGKDTHEILRMLEGHGTLAETLSRKLQENSNAN